MYFQRTLQSCSVLNVRKCREHLQVYVTDYQPGICDLTDTLSSNVNSRVGNFIISFPWHPFLLRICPLYNRTHRELHENRVKVAILYLVWIMCRQAMSVCLLSHFRLLLNAYLSRVCHYHFLDKLHLDTHKSNFISESEQFSLLIVILIHHPSSVTFRHFKLSRSSEFIFPKTTYTLRRTPEAPA